MQALENSKRATHQPQYLSIYRATRGIIFLGTPHGGSGAADWGLIASKITKCALQSPSERILRGIIPNSELLENLRKTFLQMLEDGNFTIHSFFETRPILGMYGLNSLVSSAPRQYAVMMLMKGSRLSHSNRLKWAMHVEKSVLASPGITPRYANFLGQMILGTKPYSEPYKTMSMRC